MNAVDACYHYAGIIGIVPKRMTLRQLWRMAEGRISQRRREMLELANLVWGLGSLDSEAYLLYGEFCEEPKGRKAQVSDELQSRIDAEIEKIRAENNDLPKVR